MVKRSNDIKHILERVQVECKNNKELQNAIAAYTKKHRLILPDNISYNSGIDCYIVEVSSKPVLIVGQPPVSDYVIRETEHTRKLLQSTHETTNAKFAVAV